MSIKSKAKEKRKRKLDRLKFAKIQLQREQRKLQSAKKEGLATAMQAMVQECQPSNSQLAEERRKYADDKMVLFTKALKFLEPHVKEIHINCKHPEARNRLMAEAFEKNLHVELEALISLAGDCSPFDSARRTLFFAVIKAVHYGDDYPQDVINEIRQGGIELNNSGGSRDMCDPLVWLFIPRTLHREIELLWDGIGDWRS